MGTELVPETLYSNELTGLCAREDYILQDGCLWITFWCRNPGGEDGKSVCHVRRRRRLNINGFHVGRFTSQRQLQQFLRKVTWRHATEATAQIRSFFAFYINIGTTFNWELRAKITLQFLIYVIKVLMGFKLFYNKKKRQVVNYVWQALEARSVIQVTDNTDALYLCRVILEGPAISALPRIWNLRGTFINLNN
jgi:hypothetical protein